MDTITQKIESETEAEAKLPSSSSSSPAHEFSFAISLHSNSNSNAAKSLTLPPPPPFAVDLSPADDIFFHGHLLPLHLLSHVSPRSSTNSFDSFTLPIRDLIDDQISNRTISTYDFSASNRFEENQTNTNRTKPKSFSIFRWRKGCEDGDRGGGDDNKQKRKFRFEVSRVLKRYLRMVRPLLFFKGRREDLQFHRRQPYASFSGNLSWRNRKQDLRGRRGEFSAPASMRTSPTNSGLLVPPGTKPPCGGDSTMEELQAAIQAAIAHCKNSISAEEKMNC